MAGNSGSSRSKDLLQLERNSAACLESKLFVCNKDDAVCEPGLPTQKPPMFPVPRSCVLGKVKDFLGVISESNKKLLHDAKENPDNYDIEVLHGKESEVIEMDLMLGIADLHTPEAVAAAESAMAGYQPASHLLESSSGSDSEDSSEEDNNNDGNDCGEIKEPVSNLDSQSVKSGSKDTKRDFSSEKVGKPKPKKRSKIVELP